MARSEVTRASAAGPGGGGGGGDAESLFREDLGFTLYTTLRDQALRSFDTLDRSVEGSDSRWNEGLRKVAAWEPDVADEELAAVREAMPDLDQVYRQVARDFAKRLAEKNPKTHAPGARARARLGRADELVRQVFTRLAQHVHVRNKALFFASLREQDNVIRGVFLQGLRANVSVTVDAAPREPEPEPEPEPEREPKAPRTPSPESEPRAPEAPERRRRRRGDSDEDDIRPEDSVSTLHRRRLEPPALDDDGRSAVTRASRMSRSRFTSSIRGPRRLERRESSDREDRADRADRREHREPADPSERRVLELPPPTAEARADAPAPREPRPRPGESSTVLFD